MLSKVNYGGVSYFAIEDEALPSFWRLQDGTVVRKSDCVFDGVMTRVWQETFDRLPVLLAFCYEHKVEVFAGLISVYDERAGLIGSNPVTGVIATVSDAANRGGYNAVYAGPELHECRELFWEAVIKGFHLPYTVCVCDSQNALLDIMRLACKVEPAVTIEN